MVSVRDERNLLQLPGPGNLLQESVREVHVALDLEPLRFVEAALGDHEEADLFGGEVRPPLSFDVVVLPPREAREMTRLLFPNDSRLIRLLDDAHERVELLRFALICLLEVGD